MPEPSTVTIRPATEDDWPVLWEIVRTVVAEGTSYAYPDDLTSEQAHGIWMEPPPGETVVAVVDGRVVGTAKWGPNRPGRGAHVATASFMVGDAARGHGVGRALGRYVVDRARAAGYRSMQFNAVVETNAAAVALWQQLGFRIVGTVPEAFDHPAHGYVGLHVMHLDLGAATA
jgi:L-amino acid N-acyltransferase YncA